MDASSTLFLTNEELENLKKMLLGLNRADLVMLNAGTREFCITRSGGTPQMGQCFFYVDREEAFFFYTELDINPDNGFSVNVNAATTHQLKGPSRLIRRDRIELLEHNLSFLFMKQNFMFPEKPAFDRDVLLSVNFS